VQDVNALDTSRGSDRHAFGGHDSKDEPLGDLSLLQQRVEAFFFDKQDIAKATFRSAGWKTTAAPAR
jgi:hypothetical protein